MNAAFISYSRKNKPFIQKLADAFKQAKRKVWIDWEGIPHGSDWWNEIESGIETANAFIFIITPESLESEVCARELEHALKNNKKLVPILHKEVTGEIPHALAKLDWIFFRDEQDGFTQSFLELLDTLDTDLESAKTHTRLLTRALDWESHDFGNSYLLHGQDLRNARQWITSPSQGAPRPTELHFRYIATSSESESRNQRLIIVGFVIVIAVTMLLAFYAEEHRKEAEANHVKAEANRVKAEHQQHLAMVNGIEAMSYLSEAYLATSQELDALYYAVSALKGLNNLEKQHYTKEIGDQINKLEKKVKQRAEKAINQTRERNRLELHVEKVQTVAFTPKNNFLLSGSSDNTVKLWTVKGEKLLEYQHNNSIYGLAVANDDSFFASASADNTVKLWQLPKDKNECIAKDKDACVKIREPLGKLPHCSKVYAVDISSDNKFIATASSKDGIQIWAAPNKKSVYQKTQQPLITLKEDKFYQKQPIFAVKFSHNGKYLAAGGADRIVRLWQWDSKSLQLTPIKQFKTHKDRIYALDFSRDKDNTTLVSGSADNTLCFWNIPAADELPQTNEFEVVEKPEYSLEAHNNWVYDVSYKPYESDQDARMLASSSANGEVKLWSVDGTLLRTFSGSSARTTALSFSYDGKWLASAGGDNIVRLYYMPTGGESIKTLEGHTSGLKDVDFSPNNYKGNPIIASSGTDGTIRIWDSETYRLVSTIHLRNQNEKINVRDVDFVPINEFTPEGSLYIAAATYNNTVAFYDLRDFINKEKSFNTSETPEPEPLLPQQKHKIKSIALHPQRPLLATTYSKNIKLYQYNLSPSEPLQVKPLPCKLERQKGSSSCECELEGHTGSVLAISFSTDGRILASSSTDGTARLWHFDENHHYTGKSVKLGVTNKHKDWVNNLSFSPDGKYLATAGSDNLVKLWDIETGQFINNLVDPALSTISHRDWVWDVSFAPSSIGEPYLVSGGADNLVKIWTYSDSGGKLVKTLTSHNGWVRSAGFHPHKKEVVSGGADQKVILWDLDKITKNQTDKDTNLLKAGCKLLKDYLTNNNKHHGNQICEEDGT